MSLLPGGVPEGRHDDTGGHGQDLARRLLQVGLCVCYSLGWAAGVCKDRYMHEKCCFFPPQFAYYTSERLLFLCTFNEGLNLQATA